MEFGVVFVLAFVDVENFDKLVDGFFSTLLDSEERPEDFLVLVEFFLLLDVLFII